MSLNIKPAIVDGSAVNSRWFININMNTKFNPSEPMGIRDEFIEKMNKNSKNKHLPTKMYKCHKSIRG